MQIQLINHHKKQIDLNRLKNLAQLLLKAEDCSDMVEVSVLLTDDTQIAKLNETYRGIKGPTDVLSFSQNEGEDFIDPSSYRTLGDVIISVDSAERQALEHKHALEKELDLLLAHGLLHLLGYDHMEDQEAKIMFGRQETILKEFSE